MPQIVYVRDIHHIWPTEDVTVISAGRMLLEGHRLLCRLSTQLASSVSEIDGSLYWSTMDNVYKFSARIGSCDTRVSRRRCLSTCTDRRPT